MLIIEKPGQEYGHDGNTPEPKFSTNQLNELGFDDDNQ